MPDREFILMHWGNSVLDAIDAQTAEEMSMREFLNHCTAMGGNWGGMLLSGIRKLYPEVWEAIPDDMGIYNWQCLCATIRLLNVHTEE